MTRPFNFSPGPAVLPEPVLRRAAAEMLDWHGTGMSVTEMSHRGKEFMSIYHADAGRAARAAGDPRRLQAALPAGRRDRPERDRADEPAARKDARRLRQHRRLVEALDRRGRALLHRQRRRERRRQRLHRDPAAERVAPRSGAPPTSTSARTRRSSASSTTGRRTPAPCRWSPTCRRTSCRGRSTSRATA